MSLGEWLVVAGACALGAASPGPSLVVVAGHALGGSRASGVACALAHACGVGLYALATVVGLAAVLAAHPGLYQVIVLAGAAYLAWLALRQWRSAGPPEGARGSLAERLWAAARNGFVMALLNPKIALFFLAVFSPFAGPDPDWGTVAMLWATATTIDGVWYGGVALALTSGRWLERLRARGPWIDRGMALALLALAGWAAWRGLVMGL